MIYNTPYQDLIAVKGITQKFLEEYKEENGFYPQTKPGIFFNSTFVGLQVEGYRHELVTRKHPTRTKWENLLEMSPDFYTSYEINLVREVLEEITNLEVSVREQPAEIAKAFRFRLNLI
ncbi:MAG: hypothetical protein JSU04_07480 [Bdellovibrionales bacterium]|nr:hypothetical protein [Bdellovibrionales bacterium]